jgi:sucrose phosphorylase
MLHREGSSPLVALADFAEARLDCLSHLHVLPFFPSSSDEGFSVKDYREVDPAFGGWSDIQRIGQRFSLVFDLVLNHASVQGDWFRAFLEGRPPYDRFFIERPGHFDAGPVFRPRVHPLLGEFRRSDGSAANVWTTFSPDQADLDYSNPNVLLEMVDVLLSYLERGAGIIRLDAIAYVWKQDGTPCIDLPGAHLVVKLLREILDFVAPEAALLSETNFPNDMNLSYFGSGDEASLVYNFSLPPLVLHAFVSGHAEFLATWAAGLPRLDERRALVNFLASHDGIGLTPARGMLPDPEVDRMVEVAVSRGALVSQRSTAQGPKPYEINSGFLDAVADPALPVAERARIFLACHAAMLALAGIPAIYFHSLVGSRNWLEGPSVRGYARAINRERLDVERLDRELDDASTLRHMVFWGISRMLRERRKKTAFEPSAAQLVLAPDGSGRLLEDRGDPAASMCGPIFGLLRGRGLRSVLALVNVSGEPADCAIPDGFVPSGQPEDPSQQAGMVSQTLIGRRVVIQGYGIAWLEGSFAGG